MKEIPSLELYRGLYLARCCEQNIIRHYPEDEMRTPMHMSMGQEFIPVGVCQALEGKADVFCSYRSHAAFLAQTMDSDRFFGELYGRQNGTAEGKGGSMHLAAPDRGHLLSSAVVATSIPVAVGAGFSNKRLATGRIAVVFFGDGAVDAGVFFESVNMASLFRIPVLFVCEDNGFAVHTLPAARRGYDSLENLVRQFRCHVCSDDSNDVENVYRMTRDALEQIRHDPGPVFMNIKCYRYLEHVGIGEDWHYGYRSRDDYEQLLRRDSLHVQRKRLLDKGFGEMQICEIESMIEESVRNSVKLAKATPGPGPERLYAGVFYAKN
jgi:TPP-dependent pyruvate/acetoin dehydrogenase alpha subunit